MLRNLQQRKLCLFMILLAGDVRQLALVVSRIVLLGIIYTCSVFLSTAFHRESLV